jgi:DNA repair protein RecO (recombination protein O)
MQLSSNGIVIRAQAVEGDRVLQILTGDRGIVTAYARSAGKPRGRLTSSTELLCYGRFSFFVNRDRYTLDNADLEQSFFSLRRRVDSLALATYIAELFGELAPREEEAGDYLRLILNSLHLLAEERRPPEQLKAICELRLMTMAGYMPDLVGCRECGDFEDAEMRFWMSSGEIACSRCAPQLEDGALLGAVAENYLLYHMQKKPKSLEFYHSLRTDPVSSL